MGGLWALWVAVALAQDVPHFGDRDRSVVHCDSPESLARLALPGRWTGWMAGLAPGRPVTVGFDWRRGWTSAPAVSPTAPDDPVGPPIPLPKGMQKLDPDEPGCWIWDDQDEVLWHMSSTGDELVGQARLSNHDLRILSLTQVPRRSSRVDHGLTWQVERRGRALTFRLDGALRAYGENPLLDATLARISTDLVPEPTQGRGPRAEPPEGGDDCGRRYIHRRGPPQPHLTNHEFCVETLRDDLATNPSDAAERRLWMALGDVVLTRYDLDQPQAGAVLDEAITMARRRAEESPEDALVLDDLRVLWSRRGLLEGAAGDVAGERRSAEEALAISRRVEDLLQTEDERAILCHQLTYLGGLAARAGQAERAREHWVEALALHDRLDPLWQDAGLRELLIHELGGPR